MAAFEFRTAFILAGIFSVFYIQIIGAKPATTVAPQGDEFANKAADVLDSTLLSFKEGLNNLIQDSKLLSNMMSKLATDIIKLAPQGKALSDEETRQRLHELNERANRTLSEGLFQMDDD